MKAELLKGQVTGNHPVRLNCVNCHAFYLLDGVSQAHSSNGTWTPHDKGSAEMQTVSNDSTEHHQIHFDDGGHRR